MEIKNKLTVTRGEGEGGEEGASKGTQSEDSRARAIGGDCASGGDGHRVGVSNGGKGRTTITEQLKK